MSTSFEPTPELAALMAAGPLLARDEAERIAEEFHAARRQNEIREWNPAICALVTHIFKKVRDEGSLADALRDKARTATDKRQIEVPIFSYNRTFLRGDTKPWDLLDITDTYVNHDGEIVSYTYQGTVGDACRRQETTISKLWEDDDALPILQRTIPLRKLLQMDTCALGMLSVLLGPNIKVVQHVKPAHITTDNYTVCKVELVAKMFLLKEDQVIPLGESFGRTRALEKWFPPPVEAAAGAEESTIDGCHYEWCDGSCGDY